MTGSLTDWESYSKAHNIDVETLLLNGKYDEVTNSCIEPWHNAIPNVKWVTLENSAHMGHWEEREQYFQVLGSFLVGV